MVLGRLVGTLVVLLAAVAGCHRQPRPTYEYEDTETRAWTGMGTATAPEGSAVPAPSDDPEASEGVPPEPTPARDAIEAPRRLDAEAPPSAPVPAPGPSDSTVEPAATDQTSDREPEVPAADTHRWYKAKSW